LPCVRWHRPPPCRHRAMARAAERPASRPARGSAVARWLRLRPRLCRSGRPPAQPSRSPSARRARRPRCTSVSAARRFSSLVMYSSRPCGSRAHRRPISSRARSGVRRPSLRPVSVGMPIRLLRQDATLAAPGGVRTGRLTRRGRGAKPRFDASHPNRELRGNASVPLWRGAGTAGPPCRNGRTGRMAPRGVHRRAAGRARTVHPSRCLGTPGQCRARVCSAPQGGSPIRRDLWVPSLSAPTSPARPRT
jgi:hypothetical protein